VRLNRPDRHRFVVGALVLALATLAVACVGHAALVGGDGAPTGRAPGRTAAARGGRPPVVMLVLDEVSLTSFLDRTGRVDSVLYPNLARLSRDGTVFKNFTAANDDTAKVTPSLLSGQMIRFGGAPTYREYPRNLFTLLAGAGYGLDVSEEASLLCPHRLCPQNPANPPAHDPRRVLRELAGGRVARLDAWLRGVHPSPRPTLFFKHLLLPHLPWQFLPSGRLYKRGFDEPIRGMSGPPSFGDRWLLIQAYQRHLLQTVYTDRLLGRVLTRLRATRLYDRSLVVVTADNGEAFLHMGSDRHRSDPQTFTDIASTPLLVKRPFEHSGRYSRLHVQTTDVLPTIAGVVGVKIPWRGPGRSAFASRARVASRVVVVRNDRRRLSIGLSGYEARTRESLARKVRLFGDRSIARLYAPGPFSELLGHPVGDFVVRRPGRLRLARRDPAALAHVRLTSPLLPTLLAGVLRGPGAQRWLPVAIAINGTVVATCRTAKLSTGRTIYVSALVPEAALRNGRNDVAAFVIEAARAGPPALRRL
jgi:hypothetical protein